MEGGECIIIQSKYTLYELILMRRSLESASGMHNLCVKNIICVLDKLICEFITVCEMKNVETIMRWYRCGHKHYRSDKMPQEK